MSTIQVADQTFVAAPAGRVADYLGDPTRWSRWWPDLRIEVRENRGEKGLRWGVQGALTGTMEVWLDQQLDGVVINYFLHAEPIKVPSSPRAILALNKARRVAGKAMAFEAKETLERERVWGEPVHQVH